LEHGPQGAPMSCQEARAFCPTSEDRFIQSGSSQCIGLSKNEEAFLAQ
jgi:hypothetical protein